MKFSETRQNVRDMIASAQTGKADKATCANLPSPLEADLHSAEQNNPVNCFGRGDGTK